MWQLHQYPLCPFSRKVRFALAEKAVPHELVREHPWERRDAFTDLNPAAIMWQLHQYPLGPFSRKVRFALAEKMDGLAPPAHYDKLDF